MNLRRRADMLVLFPKRVLAVFQDLTMPKRDWSEFDAPTVERKKPTWNSVKFSNARKGR